MFQPLEHLSDLIQWTLMTLAYFFQTVWSNEVDVDYRNGDSFHNQEESEVEVPDSPPTKGNEKEFDQRLLIQKTQPEPCDQEMWIYKLVHYTDKNTSGSPYNKNMSDDCVRPFIIQPVVGTNLVLVVINTLCKDEEVEIETPTPKEIDLYNMSLGCFRVLNNDFPRRHYMSCINRSKDVSYTFFHGFHSYFSTFQCSFQEQDIKLCGKSGIISPVFQLLLIVQSLMVFLEF